MVETPLSTYNALVERGDIVPDEAQRNALQELEGLHHSLIQKKQNQSVFQQLFKASGSGPKGLYLHGPVGRGKSMLMDLFIETLPDTLAVRRVHFHEFMREVQDYLHNNRTKNIPGLAKKIGKETKLLCFDEFHVSDVADAMILQRLFSALLNQGLILIATSNYPPDRLYEGGLQRKRFLPFIELIKNKMKVIAVEGPVDYRARELGQTNTYFFPLNKETREKAARLFHEFSGQERAKEHTLPLKGRQIHVMAANGVASCKFAELCERPAGAEDYLALAKKFETIFILDIPRLGYDRRNEAKRFMTLIDVLYEAGTRIVITAAEPAENLYQGHDHSFEFQRTVSRLNEMTSDKYLEKF